MQLSPVTASTAYAILAEAYLLNGHLLDGSTCASFAAAYADEAASEPCRARAESLQMVTNALNGDLASARKILSPLAEDSRPDWAVTLAYVLVRGADHDAAALVALDKALSAGPARDVVEQCVAALTRAHMQTLAQDFRGAVGTVDALVRDSAAPLFPPLLIEMAVALQALLLFQLGEPGNALVAMSGRASLPEHVVCHELLRATAYLQLGDPTRAVRATDPCKAVKDHAVRTLASSLLRRAVAFEALGEERAADSEFSRASHLAVATGSLTHPMGLPVDVLQRLSDRLAAREATFSQEVLEAMPQVEPPEVAMADVVLGHLTPRETVLAQWLTSDLSLATIAERLHVSVNTLKTQTRSLYAKLGVSSRAEAVTRIRRSGLFVGVAEHSAE